LILLDLTTSLNNVGMHIRSLTALQDQAVKRVKTEESVIRIFTIVKEQKEF
jgi:hypothetical protein